MLSVLGIPSRKNRNADTCGAAADISARFAGWVSGRKAGCGAHDAALLVDAGAAFTGFTGTKVQILTQQLLLQA